ncbi:MAG TPA: HIRAN domain-containing protein [Phycisphaerae bacterium]|jgi:hypothetical protein
MIDHNQLSVAGESHDNDDGTSRQAIIRNCALGEELKFEREPQNPYDKNAVRVLRQTGEQIGYLFREDARRVTRLAKKNYKFGGFVSFIGNAENGMLGLCIELVEASPDEPESRIDPYMVELRERVMTGNIYWP